MAGKNDDAGKGGERLSGQRLPERALTCWRVGGFLYYTAARAFTIFTFIWMAVFLLLCFVYYPMYYRQYCYSVGGMMVRVSRGVIYNQVDAVYIRNLQYTTLSQNLLQRLMNLATAVRGGRRGAHREHQLRGGAPIANSAGQENGGGRWNRPRLSGFVRTRCTS